MVVNVYFCNMSNATLPIFNELRHLRNRNLKLWFSDADRSLVAKFQVRDVNFIRHDSLDHNLGCYRWNIETEEIVPLYENDGLRHLVSRYTNDKTSFICVDNSFCTNNQLVLFQDARHKADYPKEFVKIPCFNELEGVLGYLESHNVFSFSLDDSMRFKKVSGAKQVQGANIYKEISTGRYWYKDMLHRNHYEVFDKTGREHLGEADMNGILDSNKADKTKSISI